VCRTGGGLSPDGCRWVSARPGYLLPVKVLARLFRNKFLAGVQEAYRAGQPTLGGSVAAPFWADEPDMSMNSPT